MATRTGRLVVGVSLLALFTLPVARADTTTSTTDPWVPSFLGGDPFAPGNALVATTPNVPSVMDGLSFLGGATFDFAQLPAVAAAATPSPVVPGSLPTALAADPTVGAPPPVFTGNLAGAAAPIHGGLGFYPGDGAEPVEVHQFQSDRVSYAPADTVVLMEDTSSDANMRGSTWGHFLQPGGWEDVTSPRPTMVISVPLAFGGFSPGPARSALNLEEVADGSHDGAYLYLAQALRSAGYPAAVIRLGWEFDGAWTPWEAVDHPDLYVAAFRHIAYLFRTVSPGFLFDWTGAAGQRFDGTTAYPGDDVVDIVGMDIYDGPGTSVGDLAGRAAFAAAHGKPVSYAEWGLTSNPGDDPGFLQAMHDWFASRPASGPGSLAYQSYFLGDAVGSPLSHYPRSELLFRSLFGSAASGGPALAGSR